MHYRRRCGSYHISFGRCCPGAFFRLVRPAQDLQKAFWGIQFEELSLGRWALSSCPPQRSNRPWKVEEMNLRPREEKWSKSHHGTQIRAQDSALLANMCCGHPRADHRFLSNLSVSLKPKIQDGILSLLWWQAGGNMRLWLRELVLQALRNARGSHHLFLSLRRLWPPGKPSAWAGSQCLSISTLPMMCWTCGVSWKRWSSRCPRVQLGHQIPPSQNPSETQGYKTCVHFGLRVLQVLKFKLWAFKP